LVSGGALTSNQLYQIKAPIDLAPALCLWLNSVWVIIHLLQTRAETEGAFSDILLEQIPLIPVPDRRVIEERSTEWNDLALEMGNKSFPSLREQFRSRQPTRLKLDHGVLRLLSGMRKLSTEMVEMLDEVYDRLADELEAMKESVTVSRKDSHEVEMFPE